MSTNHIRSKWAAVGAAVAVSLGAGGIGITQATTSSGEMPIYLPIEPCRLADTRTEFQVGPRSAPLGPNETYTLSGQGAVGNCNLPTGTAALSLNVTAINATAPTFVSLFPAGASLPVASHLNPLPGQGPVPNAVNVDLSAGGEFSVYNLQGNVDIFIDVVGVFDDHVHTGDDIVDGSLTGADVEDGSLSGADVEDGSLTGADVEDGSLTGADVEDESITGADIDDATVSNADTSNEPGVASDFMTSQFDVTSTPTVVAATSIRVPSDGYVSIEVTGLWRNTDGAAADIAFCQLQKGATGAVNTSEPWFRLDDGNTGVSWNGFSAHRIMEISVADNPLLFQFGQAISLVCDQTSGDVDMDDVFISATFHATSYRPSGFIFIPLNEAAADGAASNE